MRFSAFINYIKEKMSPVSISAISVALWANVR